VKQYAQQNYSGMKNNKMTISKIVETLDIGIKDYLWVLKEQGKEFYHQGIYEIADSSSINFLIDFSGHTSNKKQIIAIPAVYHTLYGSVKVQVYRNTNYTGGSVVPFYCTNTIINSTMETVVKTGASGETQGVLTEARNVGVGATNHSSGGDASSVGIEFIRPSTSKTLIVITNNSGETTEVTFAQVFYEI